MVKDGLSDYVWLELSASADSEYAAEVLVHQTRVFTAPDVWVFDQDYHFRNDVLDHFSSTSLIRHNLTVATFPWMSGPVESVLHSVLSVTMTMPSELKLAPQDWSSVLLAAASALSGASLRHSGRRGESTAKSPLEEVTGIKPKRQTLRVVSPSTDHLKTRTLEHARAIKVTRITNLQVSLNAMHKNFALSVGKRRQHAFINQN